MNRDRRINIRQKLKEARKAVVAAIGAGIVGYFATVGANTEWDPEALVKAVVAAAIIGFGTWLTKNESAPAGE